MQNETCLGKPYHNISFWNMNIFGKCIAQGHTFNTHVNQISLTDKVVYQNWSIWYDSLLNMCICINNILHLVLECLVPHHLGPHHQEPEYDHLLVVQSSGVDIFVHDFLYNDQINLIFDIKWNSFDVNCFLKVYLQKYFLHVL